MQADRPEVAEDKLQFVSPGQYAFVQDQTTGHIKVYSGPAQCNPSTQESPVSYDHETRQFTKCTLRRATRLNALARRGEYLVLVNPVLPPQGDSTGRSVVARQPRAGQEAAAAAALDIGKTVNIPGPVNFPLFPQQHAITIEGHRLRSNEYLIVRIVDEDEAKANWSEAVIKAAETPQSPDGGEGETPSDSTTVVATAEADELDLSLGQLLIIKGTEVSFYIPPTGVEVVPYTDNDDEDDVKYVRNACTLENLEYCILIDENGSKRYEIGPAVVFPMPTEQFWRDARKNRKFRAVELTSLQGIHVKCVADYEGPDYESPSQRKKYKAGDELWLTGKKTPIYLPQAEHALITYGEGTKIHNGTTVPEGEGRYVLDKENGVINTEKGPQILLPDPRRFTLVRRSLTERQCMLWYPNNREVAVYNAQLRNIGGPSEQGAVSEAAFTKSRTRGRHEDYGADMLREAQISSGLYAASLSAAEPAERGFEDVGTAVGNQGFERGSGYAKPRMLNLGGEDTKYGVPKIRPYIGYAVQVVSASGKREVVEGPETVLLDYDQTLEILQLSKGKKKQSEDRIETVYLRTRNNKVSDVVDVLTADHIPMQIQLSYSVDFDPEAKDCWFDVEDYVKLLTDHARSVLKGRIRKIPVQSFYEKSTDIIRDICLGEAVQATTQAEDDAPVKPTGKMVRPLMRFSENGMIVKDVDVLEVSIQDTAIRQLLEEAQRTTIRTQINVQQATEQLEATRKTESVSRQVEQEKHETVKVKSDLELQSVRLQLQTELERIKSDNERHTKRQESNKAQVTAEDIIHTAKLDRQKAEDMLAHEIEKLGHELEVAMLQARTESTEKTFQAAKDGMADIALALSNDNTLQVVAKALSLQNALGGGNLAETVKKAFEGAGLAPLMAGLTNRIRMPGGNNEELVGANEE